MSGTERITVGGCDLWADVVELPDGLRLRVGLDEWEQIGLYRGEPVEVKRAGKRPERLFVAEAVEQPPPSWVILSHRLSTPPPPGQRAEAGPPPRAR